MVNGILTMSAAESTVQSAVDGLRLVKSSKITRAAHDHTVVVHDSDEWGTVELRPSGFDTTRWWFAVRHDGVDWVVWYDGHEERWAAVSLEDVDVCNGSEFKAKVTAELHMLTPVGENQYE